MSGGWRLITIYEYVYKNRDWPSCNLCGHVFEDKEKAMARTVTARWKWESVRGKIGYRNYTQYRCLECFNGAYIDV